METLNQLVAISIHAPPRGATICRCCSAFLPSYFNSRPSARGDPNIRYLKGVINDFNSRPSARGDAQIATEAENDDYFNSRPSARGDMAMDLGVPLLCIFQFTPLREGRHRNNSNFFRLEVISIHAPPRGATLSGLSALPT